MDDDEIIVVWPPHLINRNHHHNQFGGYPNPPNYPINMNTLNVIGENVATASVHLAAAPQMPGPFGPTGNNYYGQTPVPPAPPYVYIKREPVSPPPVYSETITDDDKLLTYFSICEYIISIYGNQNWELNTIWNSLVHLGRHFPLDAHEIKVSFMELNIALEAFLDGIPFEFTVKNLLAREFTAELVDLIQTRRVFRRFSFMEVSVPIMDVKRRELDYEIMLKTTLGMVTDELLQIRALLNEMIDVLPRECVEYTLECIRNNGFSTLGQLYKLLTLRVYFNYHYSGRVLPKPGPQNQAPLPEVFEGSTNLPSCSTATATVEEPVAGPSNSGNEDMIDVRFIKQEPVSPVSFQSDGEISFEEYTNRVEEANRYPLLKAALASPLKNTSDNATFSKAYLESMLNLPNSPFHRYFRYIHVDNQIWQEPIEIVFTPTVSAQQNHFNHFGNHYFFNEPCVQPTAQFQQQPSYDYEAQRPAKRMRMYNE